MKRRLTRLTADLLSRRLVEAIKQARIHRDEFEAFDGKLRERVPGLVEQWEKMLVEWEADYSKPCPYIPTTKRMSLSDVRQAIAEEEERERQRAIAVSATPKESALAFVACGMELEEQQ